MKTTVAFCHLDLHHPLFQRPTGSTKEQEISQCFFALNVNYLGIFKYKFRTFFLCLWPHQKFLQCLLDSVIVPKPVHAPLVPSDYELITNLPGSQQTIQKGQSVSVLSDPESCKIGPIREVAGPENVAI